jgi:hypothetical protein
VRRIGDGGERKVRDRVMTKATEMESGCVCPAGAHTVHRETWPLSRAGWVRCSGWLSVG